MNKVTKDIMKWFPVLSESNAMVVHTQMMYDGVDFSAATNYELKQAAYRAIRTIYPETLPEIQAADQANAQGYLDGFAGLVAASTHPKYVRSYAMGQRHAQGSK
jgi:hypothetical protein